MSLEESPEKMEKVRVKDWQQFQCSIEKRAVFPSSQKSIVILSPGIWSFDLSVVLEPEPDSSQDLVVIMIRTADNKGRLWECQFPLDGERIMEEACKSIHDAMLRSYFNENDRTWRQTVEADMKENFDRAYFKESDQTWQDAFISHPLVSNFHSSFEDRELYVFYIGSDHHEVYTKYGGATFDLALLIDESKTDSSLLISVADLKCGVLIEPFITRVRLLYLLTRPRSSVIF